MIRLAANLSMMFAEVPMAARPAAAAACGFRGVEVQFPYDLDAGVFGTALGHAGTALVLFNLPPGDWAAGERGLAALPGREAAFEAGLERALALAARLGCPRLHAMAGIADAADPAARRTFCANLRLAAARCAAAGITVLIEPLNTRDVPGYYLTSADTAADIIAAVGTPNLKLQFDFYHAQIMGGDITHRLHRLAPLIGHVQIAGVPDRTEPDRGELAYARLFAVLEEVGYDGWVGAEYRPAGETRDGLGWAAPWGITV